MLRLIVTKDLKLSSSLPITSCLPISIKTGTIYAIDADGYLLHQQWLSLLI